jgi:peptide chain release factor 1
MNFAPLIDKKSERFAELETAIAAPNLYDDPKRAQELLREHTRLKETLAVWADFEKNQRELAENRDMAKGTDELAEMARAELPELEKRAVKLEQDVQLALRRDRGNSRRDRWRRGGAFRGRSLPDVHALRG